MRVKKVPLQDLELWPDEVICFTAYTDTRNPVQQRRTYVDGKKLKAENAELRAKLVMHESVQKHNEKLINSEREKNKKLRELVKAMTPFLCCMPFASCNTLAASVRKRMSELGIEVPE